jgi:hypothetical protein
MARYLICLVALASLGCAKPQPEPEPAPPQPESMIDRNTPLNEEVDEVAKVRDEVLDKK